MHSKHARVVLSTALSLLLLLLLTACTSSVYTATTTLAAECMSAGRARASSVLDAECVLQESCTVCALVHDVAACDANMICCTWLVAPPLAGNSSQSAAAPDNVQTDEHWIVVPVATSSSSSGTSAAAATIHTEDIATLLATGHLTIDGWSRVNDKPSTTLALPQTLVAGFATLRVLKLRNVSLQGLQLPVLRNIHTLELSGTGLVTLDTVLARPVLAQTTQLRTLTLSHNLLTEVPPRVYELAHLRKLQLAHNAIARQRLAPVQFAFLSTTLATLDVDADAFETVGCDRTVAFASNPHVRVCDPALDPTGTTAASSSTATRSPFHSEIYDSDTTDAWMGGIGAFVLLAAAVACALAKRETLKQLLQSSDAHHRQQQRAATQQQSDAMCYVALHDTDASSSSAIDTTLLATDVLLVTWRRDPHRIQRTRLLSGSSKSKSAAHTWLGAYGDTVVVVRTLLDTADAMTLAAFRRDVRAAARFAHPNVVRFCGVAYSERFGLQALTEFMDRSDLATYLGVTRTATPLLLQSAWWGTRRVDMARDVAQALLYLHSLERVAHGQLTTRCVLLNHEFSAKLSGFGSVQPLGEYGAASLVVATPTVTAPQPPEGRSYTLRWCAPEVLCGASRSEAADMFAFGVVLAELDALERPVRIRTPTVSASCPVALRELLLACLAHDPSERPSAATAVQALHDVADEIHRAASLAGATALVPTAAEALE